MNYLSLFSGIGGLDLGLDRAGMTCVGQVELDDFCRQILTKHWPEVPKHDDVRTAVEWWKSEPRPAVHVVAGGFPCQPFSTAGRRQGTTDERWGWPWYYDVVRALRPRYIVVENVAALLRDADAFGWILADLAEGGYDAEWDCVPAAAIGAPHIRDRLFVVAYAHHEGLDRGSELPPGRDALRQAGAVRPDADGCRAGVLADAHSAARRPAAGDAVAGAGGPAIRLRAPQPRGRRGAVADTYRKPVVWTPVARPERAPWPAEPEVGRVVDGVPARVVRPQVRALGNAVVPQVAEHIGRLIMGASAGVAS